MKITLTKNNFVDQFKAIRPDNFTIEALEALFDYIEEIEQDCEIEQEFDPIAICCDFCEFDSAIEGAKEYGFISEEEEEEDKEADCLGHLMLTTLVIELSEGVIIQGF